MFQACFREWLQALQAALGLSQIAIDGKTRRGSGTGVLKQLPLVSAGATAHSLSLGQVAVDDQSNEITAIPRLLALLDLHGAWVTSEARGCQKESVAKMIEGGGDEVLTVKDHQPHLWADLQACFNRAFERDFQGCDAATGETRPFTV